MRSLQAFGRSYRVIILTLPPSALTHPCQMPLTRAVLSGSTARSCVTPTARRRSRANAMRWCSTESRGSLTMRCWRPSGAPGTMSLTSTDLPELARLSPTRSCFVQSGRGARLRWRCRCRVLSSPKSRLVDSLHVVGVCGFLPPGRNTHIFAYVLSPLSTSIR